MEPNRFDHLSRALAAHSPRRGVFGLLTAVALVGGSLGLLTPEETEAAGRRKRRKKAHKHGKGRRRKHRNRKPRCTAESVAQTCANTCGSVTNNCQQAVDCGSCACTPACDVCFTCQDGPNTPGTCVADAAQVGDACGNAGQVCQGDGSCACDAASCPSCKTCGGDGQCAACADCCDGSGVCQDGDTNTACGSSGTCAVCTGQEQCQGQTCVCMPDCAGRDCGANGCDGSCRSCTAPSTCGGGNPGVPGVCGCTPNTCAAQGGACGTIPDGCGGTLDCGSCVCSSSGVCGTSVVTCGSGNCRCLTTTEGEVFCFLNTLASIGNPCTSSATCLENERCWEAGTCLGSGKCLRLC